MYSDSDQVAQALDETARHEDRERDLPGLAVAFVLGWLVRNSPTESRCRR
jgi:hypothetical protein